MKIHKLQPWLFAISYEGIGGEARQADLITNCYLCVGKTGALLFDTGFGIMPLLPAIREITDLPLDVVLGHGHGDHAGGAAEFARAYIHPADRELCLRHTSRTARRNILAIPRNLPPDFNENDFIHKGCCELVDLSAGQAFDLGGLIMEIIPMEGHTPGSIGLLAREHGVLLNSDCANDLTWMFLRESLMIADYAAMLRRTAALDFDIFYRAHDINPLPKSRFHDYIQCAENINPENSTPFALLPELGGRVYRHGDVGIIFSDMKL